ncbi:MAG: hypothetical protein ACAI35_05640 [Candidatus Methylacidiphilales bacterium]|nr:hypothetical protein [Candidatus Methylacidiphilales bacterium]
MLSTTSCNPNRIPYPKLVLRVGALGNQRFGIKNQIEGDPVAISAALKQQIAEVLCVLAQETDDIYCREAGKHFAPVPSGWLYRGRRALGWFFRGSHDCWRRAELAGKPAPVYSQDKPLISILGGLADGADLMFSEIVKDWNTPKKRAGQHDLVDWEHIPVIVVEEGKTAKKDDNAFVIGTIPAKSPESLFTGTGVLARDEAQMKAGIVRRRAYGYRAQSEVLRHHSDLLIAVWDPDTEGKAGGTSESVDLALRERIPVLAIRLRQGPVASPGVPVIETRLLRRPSDLLSDEVSAKTWQENIKDCLHRILSFPESASSHGHHKADHRAPATAYDPRIAYTCFLDSRPISAPWPAWLWHGLQYLIGLNSGKRHKNPGPRTGEAGTCDYHYGQVKNWASDVSGAYGDAHRGGVLASYVLAALAVIFAVMGSHFAAAGVGAAWLILISATEVLFILAMLALACTSGVEDWHEVYTDTRILAESVRCMKYIGPLGGHTPLPKLPPHLWGKMDPDAEDQVPHDPRRIWTIWFFRALVRQAPLRIVSPGFPETPVEQKDWLKTNWIGNQPHSQPGPKAGSQTAYHVKNSKAYDNLYHWLEYIAAGMFIAVIAAACIHLGEVVWHALAHAGEAHHHQQHTSASHVDPGMYDGGAAPSASGGANAVAMISFQAVLFWLCVLGPVTLAAIGGFLSQIDAVRLRQRSESMLLLLAERRKVLDRLRLDNPDSVEARWSLATEVAATAGIIVDESAGWALIYKNTDIRAG